MKNIILSLIILMISSLSASAVSISFEEGKNISTSRKIVKLTSLISHNHDTPYTVMIESKSGNDFDPSKVQFPDGTDHNILPGEIKRVPIFLKMNAAGIYKVSVCVKEESLSYFNQDEVEVIVYIRMCNSIKIERQ